MPNNKDRAERFQQALDRYGDDEPITDVVDLLADMMHWCRYHKVNFDGTLATANGHYEAEVDEEIDLFYINQRG